MQTVFTMERLKELTSRPPETANETHFQETYADVIEKSLSRLSNSPNPQQPHATWAHGFKLLHRSLQERANKRNSLLHMSDISPKLVNLSNTAIPMPGVAGSQVRSDNEQILNTLEVTYLYN